MYVDTIKTPKTLSLLTCHTGKLTTFGKCKQESSRKNERTVKKYACKDFMNSGVHISYSIPL